MPIHIGVMCHKCRKVHFVGISSGIGPGRSEGMYRLQCTPPCLEVTDFRKESMCPYRVSDDVFNRGYAEVEEYQIVSMKLPPEPPNPGDTPKRAPSH